MIRAGHGMLGSGDEITSHDIKTKIILALKTKGYILHVHLQMPSGGDQHTAMYLDNLQSPLIVLSEPLGLVD